MIILRTEKNNMIGIFKPAHHIDPVNDDEIGQDYKRLRPQVFLDIFIGYAGYYLLRKNFFLAIY